MFSLLFSELFSRTIPFKIQRQNTIYFLMVNTLFISTFFFHEALDFPLFKLKDLFFQLGTGLFLIILSIGIFFIKHGNFRSLGFSMGVFFSPFCFFLFFGIESFQFGNESFTGLQLLKSQNPILGISFIFILFFRDKKIQWFLLLLMITSLASYSKHRVTLLNALAPGHIYSRYSPAEFFWEGDFLLVEEENGVYSFVRERDEGDPIYRFTMKPLRYLKRPERQETQSFVERFSFPIVLKEGKEIWVYELYRNYRGIPMKVRFGAEKKEVSGPLF